MKTAPPEIVNMHEAKTHLSRLVAKAANGETVIIAISGKPAARLVPLKESKPAPRKLGFCAAENWTIPDDFDRWGEDEIAMMFGVGR